MWQGLLALKNETAAVQLHFVCGNKSLGLRSLPVPETGPPLRIVQRMRLETQQLEGVARRMTVSFLLLANPPLLQKCFLYSETKIVLRFFFF